MYRHLPFHLRLHVSHLAVELELIFSGILICFLTVHIKSLVALSCKSQVLYRGTADVADIATCIAAGGLYCLTPALTVWVGLNTAGQTKRAASISIAFFAAAIGGVPGSYIYIPSEARECPLSAKKFMLISCLARYPTGFGTSLAVLGFGNVIVPALYWLYCGWVNKKRDQLSSEEIHAKYSQEELSLLGDLSPLYRYER